MKSKNNIVISSFIAMVLSIIISAVPALRETVTFESLATYCILTLFVNECFKD